MRLRVMCKIIQLKGNRFSVDKTTLNAASEAPGTARWAETLSQGIGGHTPLVLKLLRESVNRSGSD